MGIMATRPNERVIALFVKVEYLKKIAEKKGYSLCSLCVEQYEREPAAAVRLVWDDDRNICHIAPVIYTRKPPHDFLYRRPLECLYDGKRSRGLYIWVYCVAHETLCEPEFVNFLLLRYPALQDNPFNEKSLRKAGCDLEKEISLWQLAEERRCYAHRHC
jgi:hypothetical protein